MIFTTKKPIIGVIHLDLLPNQNQSQGISQVTKKALHDLHALQKGGVNGIILENWHNNSSEPFITQEEKNHIKKVLRKIQPHCKIPLGINILPNDYKAALELCDEFKLPFFQLDVFVDKVLTNYTYSNAPPFQVTVNLEEFKKLRNTYTSKPALLATIHPKHYTLLSKKTVAQSAKKAVKEGADIIVITGKKTGQKPLEKNILLAKKAVNIPVFTGSGLNTTNIQLLNIADGAIVGTAFKDSEFKKVKKQKVSTFMNSIKE